MRNRAFTILGAAALSGLVACSAVLVANAAADAPAPLQIKTLSTDAARVTGGDVLVQISAADAAGV
jgi:hypothetical protein